jgi:hypothetical protein
VHMPRISAGRIIRTNVGLTPSGKHTV